MAVQAGCGFKPPTPVFAVPLPVPAEPPRRLDVTSSPPRDPGSDVIMAGRRSGQWVTLSKTLLLQLVERICQLSFQTDVTSSNTSSRLYRKSADEFGSEVETDSFWRRSSLSERGGSPTERVFDEDNGQCEMKEPAVSEESHTLLCQDDSMPTAPDHNHTTSGSGETPADVCLPAVACCDVEQNSVVELDEDDARTNAEKAPTECSAAATVEEADGGPSDAITSDRKYLDDRHHHRHQRSVCRRRLLRTRLRKKATSVGQVRCQVAARRGDDVRTVAGRRPHLRGVRHYRQSWMALSKDIVYGAVENELRQVDGSSRSLVPSVGASSPAKSTTIWNPATCLSPSEKRRSRTDCAPAVSDFRYRDVMFRQPGSDVVSQSCSVTSIASSSMLSDLLGFGSATPTVVLPAEVVLTRQRHCSYNGGEATACDVISPSVGSGLGSGYCVKAHSHPRPVSESGRSHGDVTNALNYCIRRNATRQVEEVASTVPRIWRPVGSYPAQSTTRRVARPRWVAVNKGDVCSLVDNLVSTMIASEDRSAVVSVSTGLGDVRDASTTVLTPQPTKSSSSSSSSSTSSCERPALPVTARCTVAASEPRKWKTDLLQRMRNEDT